ncbi:unnamed protein product [Heligmosomoides polygyrus]|uniref:Ovule protein n=1 Tax=Heligmosomoides polygyrus TaxID=6339 RepID=A0A183FEZ2_HELPZ|nr:unnamed protein product [Heligmosomoides polygyrus]
MEPFELILVHQELGFMELVGLRFAFLSGYSMHLCETDTDITGDLFQETLGFGIFGFSMIFRILLLSLKTELQNRSAMV